MKTRLPAALPGVLVAATLLAGCRGDLGSAEETPTPTVGSSPSESASPSGDPTAQYAVDAPAGVALTEPGTRLDLGEPATIAWAPRQSLVGAVKVTVTRIREGRLKDFTGFTPKDPQGFRQSTPYYVDVTVKNVGRIDLGDEDLPLWGVDATNVLNGASVFRSPFHPCTPSLLPKLFTPGNKADVCLTYIVSNHGTLRGVAFQPSDAFDPIIWSGKILAPGEKPSAQPSAKQKKKH